MSVVSKTKAIIACLCTILFVCGKIGWHRASSQTAYPALKSADNVRGSTAFANSSPVKQGSDKEQPMQSATDIATAQKFQVRLDRLRKQCPSWKFSPLRKSWYFNKNFILHYGRKILVCAVPKAGSTSWNMMIWAMNRKEAGLSTDVRLYTYNDTLKNQAVAQQLSHAQGTKLVSYHEGDDDMLRDPPTHKAKRLLLIRHPFARLISGWHQKFLPDSNYADLLLTRYPKLKTYLKHTEHEHKMAWKDFAKYVAFEGATPGNLDYHFVPAWELCSPCEYSYSYIVKSETIARDKEWLLRRIGAEDVQLTRNGQPPGGSLVNKNPSEKIKFYMKQLDATVIQRLYRIYERDFNMFGYTFNTQTLEAGGFD